MDRHSLAVKRNTATQGSKKIIKDVYKKVAPYIYI